MVAAVLLGAAPASAQDDYNWESWGAVTDTLTAPSKGARLYLSSPFVKPGSEKVTVNGAPLTSLDYEINYQRGLIRLTRGFGDDASVVVSYTRMPFLLDSVYSLRDIEFAEGAEPVPQRPQAETIQAPSTTFNPGNNLVFGGIKSVSFTTGSNQGASLDQTLRANVEGNLTNSIKVRALLSDNNLPIQPQGNTEELEYLDKVFVEFTGPRAKATLGDFAFDNNFTEFNSFRRELKGVWGEVNAANLKVGAAGGTAKGVFRTIQFRGTAQLQGPYELLAQGRTNGEVVIAGTERVFMDGEQLQRGQDRDYTIDYDRGLITFTPRRPITADNEIAVDLEVTQRKYERTSGYATLQTLDQITGGMEMRTMMAIEQDDSGRPESQTLDEADRAIIAAAGDKASEAVTTGSKFVGEGLGEYTLVPADTASGTEEHYVYDDSTGAYTLAFLDVASGAGDYVLDGITGTGQPIYKFVGGGFGNYIVGRLLPLPQSHRMVGTRITRTAPGRLFFDVQYNVSDFDANTLSVLDDNDNIGDAGEVQLGLKGVPFLLGALDVTGSVSTVQDRYKSLDRTRGPYFYRDWNLENEPLVGREIMPQVKTAFARDEHVRLAYDFGMIERANFDGRKQEGRLTLAAQPDQALTGRAFMTDMRGLGETRIRNHGTTTLRMGMWSFLPSATYATEEFLRTSAVQADSGIAYDRYVARLEKRHVERFAYSFEVEQRDTRQLADTTSGWVDTRLDRSLRVGLASRGGQRLTGELNFSHTEQEDRYYGTTSTADLGRLKGVLRLEGIGLRTNFDYELSQNQFRTQQKRVVFVGEGLGDFNELGEPVGNGRGAYNVVFLPTQEMVPTSGVDFALTMNWQAPRGRFAGRRGPLAWIARNVSLDQALTIKEQTTFGNSYQVYLLFPNALQRDDATLLGFTSLKQEWSLLNDHPKLDLTVRYQRDDSEDNRFGDVREEQLTQQQSVRVDRSISGLLSTNFEVRRELRRRGGEGVAASTGSLYNVTGWALVGGWGLRFSAGSSIDGDVEVRRQGDEVSEAEQVVLFFRPRAVWRLTNALNVFGRYEYSNVVGSNETLVQPFFFATVGSAQRWSLTPNLRISKLISINATYEGRSEQTFTGAKVTDHVFRIETRALF